MPPPVEDIFRAIASDRDIAQLVGQNPALLSNVTGKFRTEEEEGVVAELFGIPIGFQFGTAAGMTGVPAFIVDVLTDPTTYVTGGLGTLTKTGRAARAAGRFLKTVDDVAKLPHVSAQQKVKIMKTLGKVADKVDTKKFKNMEKLVEEIRLDQPVTESARDLLLKLNKAIGESQELEKLSKASTKFTRPEVNALSQLRKTLFDDLDIEDFDQLAIPSLKELQALRQATIQGGLTGARSFIQANIDKLSRVSREALQAAEKGDFKSFKRAAKTIKKLDPTVRNKILFSPRRLKDLQQLFLREHSQRLAPTLAQQRELGQRSLIKFSIPFTGLETSLRLPGEQALFSAIDKAVKKAPTLSPRLQRGDGLVRGAQIAAKDMVGLTTEPVINTEALGQLGDVAVQSLQGSPDKTKDFFGIHKRWIGEWLFGKDAAQQFARQIEYLVPDKARRTKIWNLIEEPEKFLIRPEDAGDRVAIPVFEEGVQIATRFDRVEKGPFGATSLFGDLKPGVDITQRELEVAQAIDTSLRNAGAFLLSEGLIENAVKGYMPRIIKRIKNPAAFNNFFRRATNPQVVSDFYRHGLNRQMPFLEDLRRLESRGVIELEKDSAKIMRSYFSEISRAAANKRFVSALDEAVMHVPSDTSRAAPVLISAKRKNIDAILEKRGLDPDDYIFDEQLTEIRNFTRRKGAGTRRPYVDGALVHKDALKKLRGLFAEGLAPPAPGKLIARPGATSGENAGRLALLLNGLAKRTLLSFSVFHHGALTESMMAAVGWPFLKGATNPKNMARIMASPFIEVGRTLGMSLTPSFINQKLRQIRDAYPGIDILETASRGGLQLGEILDAEREVLTRLLGQTTDWLSRNKIPIAPWMAERIQSGIMTIDRGLWDYMHSGYKLFAFNELYHAGLSKFPGIAPEKIAKDVAQHVNNAFGGQIWERFFRGRRGQQWMRVFLMAPDWTLSNLAIAGDVFLNMIMRGSTAAADLMSLHPENRLGKVLRFDKRLIESSDIRATFARQYALRFALINVPLAHLANKAMSGQWLDENPERFRTSINTGIDDPDTGRRVYLRLGKQFKEPFDWTQDPAKLLELKKSPLATAVTAIVFDRDIFGSRISAQEDGPLAALAKDMGYVATNFFPIGPARIAREQISPESLPLRAIEAVGVPLSREFLQRPTGGQAEPLRLPDVTQGFTQGLRETRLPVNFP